MNYKIYYKSNGRIVGILSEDNLESCQEIYESNIDYDFTLDLEDDRPEEDIFFDCSIVDGQLVDEIHSDRIAEQNLKIIRQNRKQEYPSIGDQLDSLFHAGVFPDEMASKIQSVKDKYPKA